MVKITILGCGSSEGVPMVGCACKVCRSSNSKNKRTRQSIYVESSKTKLFIDVGPDLRFQSLANKIKNIDGALITHAHADHIGGLPDLRAFCIHSHETVNIFSDKQCLDGIRVRFDYLFRDCKIGKNIAKPIAKDDTLEVWAKNKVGDIEFIPFIQQHGTITSLGFLFNNFAYSTDLKALNQRSINLLKGTKLWIVDCIGYKREFFAHIALKEMLALYEKVQPEKAIIIHMSHEIDYMTFGKKLPKGVKIAYDGMNIVV